MTKSHPEFRQKENEREGGAVIPTKKGNTAHKLSLGDTDDFSLFLPDAAVEVSLRDLIHGAD